MAFEIHSLHMGDLTIPVGHGAWVTEPVHCWYATDGTTRILVDSGMPAAPEMKAKWKVEATGGGAEAIRRGLAEAGTNPEQIDLVVLTHLHFDHAWNLQLFPGSCVVVQKEELVHAMDPVPTQRIYYTRQTLFDVLQRKRPTQLRLLEGDVEVMPGFRLLKAPGHTPGMQVAIVSTARGNAALVSDLGENYGCWYPANPRATDTPNGSLQDSFKPGMIRSESELVYGQSMRRVLEHADLVVPAHDGRIPLQLPKQWFRIPGEEVPA